MNGHAVVVPEACFFDAIYLKQMLICGRSNGEHVIIAGLHGVTRRYYEGGARAFAAHRSRQLAKA